MYVYVGPKDDVLTCVDTVVPRTLYEGEEQEEFLDCLSTRIKVHEKEIERMCNKNYQGFIESVSELHKVKSDANKLKVGGIGASYVCVCMVFVYNVCLCAYLCLPYLCSNAVFFSLHTHNSPSPTQRKIIEANAVIQDSGEKLVQSAIDLHRSRQIQKNLLSTMDTLNRCAPGEESLNNSCSLLQCT